MKPLPVYIVYFSAAALTDGSIVNYDDLYKRDAKVIAALLDKRRQGAGARQPAKKVATQVSRSNEKGGSVGAALLFATSVGSSGKLVGVDHAAAGEPAHHLPLVWRG